MFEALLRRILAKQEEQVTPIAVEPQQAQPLQAKQQQPPHQVEVPGEPKTAKPALERFMKKKTCQFLKGPLIHLYLRNGLAC